MKTFGDGRVEFLLRADRRGFGCFVAFVGDENGRAEAAALLDAMPVLTVRGTRNRPERALNWDVAGSRDDVRMSTLSDIGGVLINLEVKE